MSEDMSEEKTINAFGHWVQRLLTKAKREMKESGSSACEAVYPVQDLSDSTIEAEIRITVRKREVK